MSAISEEAAKVIIDKSRAYGLMRGACEAMLLRLPTNERERIIKLIEEADELWDNNESK